MSKKINLLETGNMLLAAQKIFLFCHVSPDGDTLGSALGLARLLEQKGKEVTVFVDDDINKSLSFIPGVDKVQRPEAGVIVEADLFVVVDASSFDRVGICNEVVKAPVLLNIDHHISNTEFADYLYLDAEAAAAGEIMCDLFEAMGWEYDEAIAVDFYTAITTDCGSFRYSNTTSKTMQRAAKLLDYGVKPNEIGTGLFFQRKHRLAAPLHRTRKEGAHHFLYRNKAAKSHNVRDFGMQSCNIHRRKRTPAMPHDRNIKPFKALVGLDGGNTIV